MQVVSGGRSLWIHTLVFTSLQLWGRLCASTSSPSLPAPTLDIYSRSKDSVVMTCKVPEGLHGALFMLYRVREKVDSQEIQPSAEEAQFTIRVEEGNIDNLFCCLYKTHEGHYSAFSPYLHLNHQKEAAPTSSTPSFPPPVLSVEPSTGVVRSGDVLSFSCSLPALPPQSQSQSQSQSGYNNKPVTFFLLSTAERAVPTSTIRQPRASQAASPEPQPGAFTVGPVRGGEEGEYTCMYQVTKRRRLVNSTVSNVVQVTIADMLPLPTLLLQQQTDVWHLLCTGSPAYPGAVFSLYPAESQLPVATRHAKAIHHRATFPVPVQDTPVVLYQCQYSVLLGKKWSNSERSPSLAVTRGTQAPSDLSGVDWPLVLGSFSAAVLFLCSVVLVVVVAHKKVKAASEKRKKREEEQYWTKDHVVDLKLKRLSSTYQEWDGGDTETTSRAPSWNCHSTFTSPMHPIH